MSVLGTGPFKRQKQTHSSKWIVGRVEDDNLYGDITSIDQDYTDISSLNCSDIFDEGSDYALSAVGDCNIRKRSIESLGLDLLHMNEYHPRDSSADIILISSVLDYYPSKPSFTDHPNDLQLSDAFHDIAEARHRKVRKPALVTNSVVNGYVKFSLVKSSGSPLEPTPSVNRNRNFSGVPASTQASKQTLLSRSIPLSPSGLGSDMRLDRMDGLLWKFYQTAFCTGRTLLKQTNLWLRDFASMADRDPCIRHCILSLASTYVLDYTQEKEWLARANEHYRQAAAYMNRALRDEHARLPGREDTVVTAIVLLSCEDIIFWENQRPRTESQRWMEGVQNAIKILDYSNPSISYNDPINVQANSIRTANANLVASYLILALPVVPLESPLCKVKHKFVWLINGTQNENLRIHAGTGLSPKLLHIYSQITSLCAHITKDSECKISPRAARFLQRKLVNFRQWSELSTGYPSEVLLMESCVLNAKGQVETAAEVTDLTAQAWVSAAQIYLQARFYRRSRSHLLIKQPLKTLMQCIKRMPCNGDLFTSQSPFFPIFIMGVVSVTEEERSVARVWFETVVGGLDCRSSVPPVWKVLRKLWIWIDQHLQEDHAEFEGPIKERIPWWEQVVGHLFDVSGVISLS